LRRWLFPAVVASTLVLVGSALAGGTRRPAPPLVAIGVSSQQAGPTHAAITARIQVSGEQPGRRTGDQSASPRPGGVEPQPVSNAHTAAATAPPVLYPSISSTSAFLRNRAPLGPGSFWYSDSQRHACLYQPDSVLPCFRVVAPTAGTPASGTSINPTAVAAAVADRLPLASGNLVASPSARGLTGASSWFWLDPAPSATTLSVTLAGEHVTVTAEPAVVEWRFGDGSPVSSGAGVPYREGPAPPEAVTHEYGTRCLPGDRGRNPYVLGSCGEDGYSVEAIVDWQIRYSASGAVGASGNLPARTTETSLAYPVSEARAFLLGRGAP
jgi:hypothetical protein